MQQFPADEKATKAREFLHQAGLTALVSPDTLDERIESIIAAAGDRIQVLGDILDYADFFMADEQLPYDEKVVEKRLRKPAEAKDLLRAFREDLAALDRFDVETLERCMHAFVELQGIKIGQIVHAVRVAVTGKGVGFGIFDTLAILGRDQTLARIDRALQLGMAQK